MPLLVQSAHNSATSGSTVTVTLGSDVTGTDDLIACIGGQASSAPSVSGVTIGGVDDNWAKAKAQAESSEVDIDCEIWADLGCEGGSTSVVVTFGAAISDAAAIVEEWSGTGTSGVDKTNGGTSSTTSWSSGATGTLSQPSEVVTAAVFCFTEGGAPTITGPSGSWTNLTQVSVGDYALMAGYQVVSATTSLTYSGTQTAFEVELSAAVIVSLKASTLVSGSDAGSGAEAATVSVSGTDAGSGADSSTIAAATGSSDTGTGADLGAVGVTSPDSGSGADTASPPPAALTAPDTGTGTEGAPSVAFTGAGDTGSGADVAVAVLGASGSDTGTGAESSSIAVEVPGADTGTGAESSSIAATAPAAADTGSGTDVAAVGISGSDAGTEGDNATQAPFIAPPLVLWAAPDKLSKTGGTMR